MVGKDDTDSTGGRGSIPGCFFFLVKFRSLCKFVKTEKIKATLVN